MIRVSQHAIDRWIERVDQCTRMEARAAILAHSDVLLVAVGFGCTHVKLGNRARLVLAGSTVVTVTPPSTFCLFEKNNTKPPFHAA